MKKYKLIKEYPGSPKLNTIFDYWTDGVSEQVYNKSNNPSLIPLKIIRLFSEFWQEIIENEYEILSFIANQKVNVIEKGTICKKDKNTNKFKSISNKLTIADLELEFLNNNKWEIYSVKRLSDGEIFTVGDKVKWVTSNFIINNFSISDNYLYANEVNVNNISHIKNPLFTTEDGVDIFEGDKVFYINFLDSIMTAITFNKVSKKHHLFKWFSTKEAAEEYVLMNTPCLSINDLINIQKTKGTLGDSLISEAEKLVKLKL